MEVVWTERAVSCLGGSEGALGVDLFTLGVAVRLWGQRKGLGVDRRQGCAQGKGKGGAHAQCAP